MIADIFVTSPDREVTKIIEKIKKDLKLDLAVAETSFEDAVSLIKGLMEREPGCIKIIASGGATLELLRKEIPHTQMVNIHPTEYDILLAMTKARRYSEKIGLFVAGSEDTQVFENLCSLLNLCGRVYVYNSWHDLRKQVEKAHRDGIKVALGVGDRISDYVKKSGLLCISATAGERTIRNALSVAKEMLDSLPEFRLKKELNPKGFTAKYKFSDIVHTDKKMSLVIEKARKYSNTDCTVLIKGESGTGKELLAQSMHNEHKLRSQGPFVAINCAALDNNLFKSELFGYAEGSFTGAVKGGKPGLIELAGGGTLFLDEIGKLKFEQQGNLLRVLQEKEVRRIGSDRLIPLDVRVIAASNENLSELVKKGVFREDLYFRLSVLKLDIPPLRERKEDIREQTLFFLDEFSERYGKSIYSFPARIFQRLSAPAWPGNSRQLGHLIERCIVLASQEEEAAEIISELLDEEFAESVWPAGSEENAQDKISVNISTLAEMNTEIVRRIRDKAKLTNSELALKLGISRPTLTKMLNCSTTCLPDKITQSLRPLSTNNS